MANEVTYMTGDMMKVAIQTANQAVAGMSVSEAATVLGATAQTQTNGTQILTFPIPYQQYGQVSTEAMYAAQLWEYWKAAGNAAGTTAFGAAGAAAVSWAQGALIGTGTGLAATAGLLTLSVPTAVAMAAPLLGVGLGYALYDTFPDLFDNIAEGLVDFTTEATQTVSALIDEAGHVLMDSAFVQKLKELFEENGVPVYNETGSYIISGLPNTDPNTFNAGSGYWDQGLGRNSNLYYSQNGSIGAYFPDNSRCIIAASSSVYATKRIYTTNTGSTRQYDEDLLSLSYTYDGKTVYYASYSSTSEYRASFPNNTGDGDSVKNVAWKMVYGEITPGGEYPVGTEGWKNSSWNPSSSTVYPTYPVPNPSTGTDQPYYPVTPYIGDTPGTTVDPDTTPQQDPTTPISPTEWPVIDPYIPPVVIPEVQIPDTPEFPVPDPSELENPGVADDPIFIPTPNLDPSIDPSAVQSTKPESIIQPDPPQNTGTSPDILFPVPGVPFPSIVPVGSDTPVPSGSPGFIQVYNPTPSEFVAFGRWLWVTYADATMDTIWNNPFDGVIGAHELYATPSKDGYSTIRSGFLDSGISSIIVRQRYTEINCGSILIPEYWGNYLDYSPYSRAYIYLPFIGIMDLDVDDIVGHAVNVLYHVDSYTGSCIAQITCARDDYSNTIYQFSGDCSVEIPMAGGSQANIKAAMIAANAYQNAANVSAGMSLWGGIASGIASAIGGALMPGAASTIGGITSGIGQAIGGYTSSQSQKAYGEAQHTAAMVSQKSHVQHSGSFGGSHGAMGIKKPYIIIRRPIQKVVTNYNKLYGYPAHKMVVIGECTGYLRCREVNVQSSLATDEEKRMIEEALKSGVYVTE